MTFQHRGPAAAWRFRIRPADGAPGVVALLTMIILGALILAIGATVSYVGQTQVILSGQFDRGQAVREAAFSCVDEALGRLKKDAGFTSGSLPVGAITCTMSVSGSGSSRTIVASATDGDLVQKVNVDAGLRLNPGGHARGWEILSWQEAGF